MAVSAQQGGVLPISQQSIFVLTGLSYHDYEGVASPKRSWDPARQATLGAGAALAWPALLRRLDRADRRFRD